MAERYAVRPLHNSRHGEGWTVWDLVEDKASGWFTARYAAELTAAVINDDPDRHALLFASVVAGQARGLFDEPGVDYPPLTSVEEYPLTLTVSIEAPRGRS